MSTLTRILPSLFLDEFFNLEIPPIYSTPNADIKHDNDKITLDLNLAGTSKENIAVEVNGKKLIIKTTNDNVENVKKLYEIPENVDSEKIVAKYENGILNIELTKSVKNNKIIKIQ